MKNCEFCDEQYSPGEKFCKRCGAALPASAQGEGENATVASAAKSLAAMVKSLPKKILIPVAAGVLVIAVALAVLLPGSSGGDKYTLYSSNLSIFNKDDGVVVTGKGNEVLAGFDDDVTRVQRSMNGAVMAALTEYDYTEGGVLYMVAAGAKDKVRIADNVHNFVISDNGDTIAYLTNLDLDAYTATLNLYGVKGKKSTEIARDCASMGLSNAFVSLSPDGKSVAYIGAPNLDADSFTGFVSRGGGAPESLGKNRLPIALSDSGRLVYYLRVSDSGESPLYVQKKGDDIKLANSLSGYTPIYFNRDYSEILYMYDGKCYLSRDGGEKAKLYNSELRPVLPAGAQRKDSYSDMGYGYAFQIVVGIDSFAGSVCSTYDSRLIYVDGKLETNRIASNIYTAAVSTNGKSVSYITDDGDVYLKKNVAKVDDSPLLIGDDVEAEAMVMTPDGTRVYYVNEDDELWTIKGQGKPERIADDVDADSLVLSAKGDMAFFLVDVILGKGDLYYSKNGGGKAKATGLPEEGQVAAINGQVYFFAGDGGSTTLYVHTGNGSFEKVMDDLTWS